MHGTRFSLASILLLTAIVAVGLAAVQAVVLYGNRMDPGEIVAACFFGGAIGAMVGLVIGLKQPRPVAGALIGLVAGAAAGAPAVLLFAHPVNLPVIAFGSVVLIVFALVVRRFSGWRPD